MNKTVIVLGASSLVGHWLLPRLDQAGFHIHAISRRTPPAARHDTTVWHRFDVTSANGFATLPACPVAVSLLPLWLLPPAISVLAEKGCKRIIAFSSTSALTKADSTDPHERRLAEQLAAAERAVADNAVRHGLALYLLRSTMIYDGVRDKNVKRLRDVLRHYRCFPLFGGGNGLRQPVHADDLAVAVIAGLSRATETGATYTLSGGETLRYRDMILRIAAAERIHPLLIDMPIGFIPPTVALARLLPRFRDLNAAMLTRMNRDLVFDHADAGRDLGFSPRAFTIE